MADKTLMVLDGDLVISTLNRVVEAAGPQKCAQDLAEMLLSPYRADLDSGNELINAYNDGRVSHMTRGQVETYIREAVHRLIAIQRQNNAPADERIASIKSLIIRSVGVGSFLYILSISLVDGNSMTKTYRVTNRHVNPKSFSDFAANSVLMPDVQ